VQDRYLPLWVGGTVVWACVVALTVAGASAQSVTGSGLNTTVNRIGSTYDITGGTRPGGGVNLFHSFGRFSLPTAADVASFRNESGAATANILGRVTGGEASTIFGMIRTEGFGAANLFLVNPSGWVFGPTATLNVGGSFHVSTADYIRLSDDVRFNAIPAAADALLTSAPPAAFGFLPRAPADPISSISTNGSLLTVDRGQTLSLVGGDVAIAGGTLTAPGGRVQVGGFTSTGEATVDGLNGSFSSFGQVTMSGASISTAADVRVDGSGSPSVVAGGTVVIRGGDVDIVSTPIDASGILTFDTVGTPVASVGGTVIIRGGRLIVDASPITVQNFASEAGAPVAIDVGMDESVTLTNGASLLTATSGAGRGGDIQVVAGGTPDTAGTIALETASSALSLTSGAGRGGDIRLTAGRVTIDGSFLFTLSAGGGGTGGDVAVRGATVVMTNGGQIQSLNQAGVDSQGNVLAGRGGQITLAGEQSVTISGSGTGLLTSTDAAGDGGRIFVTGGSLVMSDAAEVTSSASFSLNPGGTGGAIDIDARQFSLTGGATINSFASTTTDPNTLDVIPGRGGTVTVNVAADAEIAGFNTSIGTTASGGASAGNIVIDVGSLRLTDLAAIQGGLFSGDAAGNVTVTADGSILIGEGAGIASQAFAADVGSITVSAQSLTIDGGFISTGTLGQGRAGDISIDVTRGLTLVNGGQIASSSIAQATGGGGTVTVNANSVSISGRSLQPVLPVPFSDFITDTASGIFSTSSSQVPGFGGRAGSIRVVAPSVTLSDGGKISVITETVGPAGDILVSAANSFSLSGAGSGLFSTTSNQDPAAGTAGSITVLTPALSLSDRATISVETTGAGNAGTLVLDVPGTLSVSGGATLASSTSGTGEGGSLTINAGSVSLAGAASGLFSTTSSQTATAGAAGSITVTTPTLALSNGAKISVETTGAGDAGNISLTLGSLNVESGARIDSSTSGTGAGGSITLSAPTGIVTVNGAGLFSDTSGTGAGGDINIAAQTVDLAHGATISATSTGTPAATAGNINIVFGDTLEMQHSSITTQSIAADGGNITITSTGSLLHLLESQITTSVQSDVGSGGNITIGSQSHPLDFAVLNSAQIRADAFGGPGGNISIHADVYLTQNSVVSASSALSAPGTISIEAQITDVSGSLANLPESVVQAASLLRASCAAQLAEGRTSSLVVTGRGGVPPAPDGLLWSPLAELGTGPAVSRSAGHEWQRFPRVVGLQSRCGR
jgi:filamentous hemagglutinin family protein